MKNTEMKILNIFFWGYTIGLPVFGLFYLMNRSFTQDSKWKRNYNEYNTYYKKLSDLKEGEKITIGNEYRAVKINNGNEDNLKRKSILLTNENSSMLINFDNMLPKKNPSFSIGNNFKKMSIITMDINTVCQITLDFNKYEIEIRDINGRSNSSYLKGAADVADVFEDIMKNGTYPICSQLSQNKLNFETGDIK